MKSSTSVRKISILSISLFALLAACAPTKNSIENSAFSSANKSKNPTSSSASNNSSAPNSKSRESISATSSESVPPVSTSVVSGDKEVLTCGHHKEIAVKTPSTCSMRGYTTHICLECGEELYSDELQNENQNAFENSFVQKGCNRS